VSLIRDELNDFKRDKILSTAATLIGEKGYAKTSVDDIASALGATKPFVYYYFGSKVEILEEICLRTISASNKILNDLISEKQPAAWRLYHIIGGIAELAVTDANGTSIFFREERNLSENAAKASARLRKRFDSDLAGLIAEGIESGEFSVPNTKIAAYSVAGMVTWMFTWYRPTGPLGVEELRAMMARLALQTVGVAPETVSEIEADVLPRPRAPVKEVPLRKRKARLPAS